MKTNLQKLSELSDEEAVEAAVCREIGCKNAAQPNRNCCEMHRLFGKLSELGDDPRPLTNQPSAGQGVTREVGQTSGGHAKKAAGESLTATKTVCIKCGKAPIHRWRARFYRASS